MKTVEFVIMLVLSIALAFAIALWVPGLQWTN